MLLKSDILEIKNIILEASEIIEKIATEGIEITIKTDGSPVTNADIAASRHIYQKIQKIYSDIAVISEEEEIPNSYGDTFWLIDPLDGTKSFIKSEPIYTINIGLVIKNQPIFGFVTNPATGDLYFTNEKREMVVEYTNADLSLTKQHDFKALISSYPSEDIKNLFKSYNISDYEIIPGAIKFCIIATGGADLYPRSGETMEWDTAAGHALIKSSGGEIYDLNGKILEYGKFAFINKGFITYSKRLLSSLSPHMIRSL